MTQSVNVGVALGAAKTGESIGYRLLNLDGTTYAAFTTTNVAETSVAGTYVVTTAVTAPDAGARIVWGPSGTDYVASIIEAVPSVNLTTGAITAATIATDAIDADALASDAIAEINATVDTAISDAALATAANLATVDTVVDGIKAVTDNLPDSGALTSIATASALATVDSNVDAILADTGTDGVIVASIAANAINASALATDAVSEIQSGLATASALATVDTIVDAIKAVTDLLPDGGALTTLLSNVSAILTDSNELQTDWTNGGRLDLLIDAIKAKTDNLPTDPADASDIAASFAALNDLSTADIDARLAAYDAPTKAELDAGFAALNDPTAAAIADAVWDESTTGHVTSGTFGEQLKTDVDAILADTGTDGVVLANNAITAAKIATDAIDADAIAADAIAEINATVDTAISDAALATASALATVDTVVDAILDDTGTSGVVVATASKTGYSLSSAGVQAIWDALTSALTTVGSVGKRLADNIDATISSRSTVTTAQVNSEVDTALSDVGLTTTVTGRIDAAISTRSSHTAANVWSAVTRTLTANTNLNDPSAATIADAVLDELLSGHTTSGSAGEALGRLDATVSSRSTITTAQVNSEVDTALSDYDAPTKAELDAGLAALNDPSANDVVTALLAYALESGKTVQAAWLDIWSVTVGDAAANNGDTPTSITYDSPDGTVQVTHTLSETTRTKV